MKSTKFDCGSTAPPSTPNISDEDDSIDLTSYENDLHNSDENLSSPDDWDRNIVNILENGQGLLSTSDIFEESDSSADNFIQNTTTPEACVSDDSVDEDSNLENQSLSVLVKDSTLDSITTKDSENSPPSILLKVNSYSPDYLDF